MVDDKWKGLPKYICHSCAERLQSSYIFIREAREVNQKLWTQLHSISVDVKSCLEIKIESEEMIEEKPSCEEYAVPECKFQVKTEYSDYDSPVDDAPTEPDYNVAENVVNTNQYVELI